MSQIKHRGQVFTPTRLVKFMLDIAGYESEAILQRHCIDNSCGNGAFLCEVVSRYCNAFLSKKGTLEALKKELETYIHGIEIDKETHIDCIRKLNHTAKQFGIENVNWDIIHGDTLNIDIFDNKMDYVVGNPPYVRVHNLSNSYDNVKKYSFSKEGMTDIFLVFFEIGFKMLNNGGKLCYITPSSWINSLAGKALREHIRSERNLAELIDLQHYQPFKVSTYTMISLFEKGTKRDSFDLYNFNSDSYTKTHIDTLNINDADINGNYYLADKKSLEYFRYVTKFKQNRCVIVKNGFATLADKIFISDSFPFESYVIPTIKASTGRWYKAFFPYDKEGKPLSYKEITKDSRVLQYLTTHKTALLKGATESENATWYLYGRTQALKDVMQKKIAINTCIKDIASIKLNMVPEGCGIYSGLYIITDRSFDEIKSVIMCQEFIDYVALLKKYKSGGYYTFNSKDLEHYLSYSLTKLSTP